MVLTDAEWAASEPLVEGCRPHAKVPPRNPRRTLEAIVWRHRDGATWRAIPAGLGPRWMAAQPFIRRSRLGAWRRLLGLAQARGIERGLAFVPRRHHGPRPRRGGGCSRKGGTSRARDAREALGRRSRGGHGTKACVVAGGAGAAPSPSR
jgi:transposase